MVAPALPEREALGGVVDEFVGAIREGRPPLTDGASGLRVLQHPRGGVGRSLDRRRRAVPLDAPTAVTQLPMEP